MIYSIYIHKNLEKKKSQQQQHISCFDAQRVKSSFATFNIMESYKKIYTKKAVFVAGLMPIKFAECLNVCCII